MIVKLIEPRPMKRDAVFARVNRARSLIDYMNDPEKKSPEKAYQVAYMLREKLGQTEGERPFHVGARGFVSEDLSGQRAEMVVIADAASRSPNPVDHWLLSWREGELPTSEQIDKAVAIFLDHLKMADQPCVYACHGDTDNRHVHIALNRYNVAAKRMVEINGGWNLEAAHQAVALIVDRFGWQPEADARYHVVDGVPILTPAALKRTKGDHRPVLAKAAEFENRTGYRSVQRIAQEEAVPRIKQAGSWSELHALLAEVGISYEPVGTNGVVLVIGDDRIKVSSVDRGITRVRLEEGLGKFEARSVDMCAVVRSTEGDRIKSAFRADEYRTECEEWQRGREPRLVGGSARKRPPPTLESWYWARGEVKFAERWRHRRAVDPFPALFGRCGTIAPAALREIDGYIGYDCSDGVRYARSSDAPTAFLDCGSRIDVVALDDAALLAALRLASAKFDGRVVVSGSDAFRERIFVLAMANNLGETLVDPDFVARRESARENEPSQAPKRPTAAPDRKSGLAAQAAGLPGGGVRSLPARGPSPLIADENRKSGLAAQAASLPGGGVRKMPRGKPEPEVSPMPFRPKGPER